MRRFRLRKSDQRFETCAGSTGVDRFSGAAHTIEEIFRAACSNQSRGGIDEDDVAVRTVLVGVTGTPEDAMNDLCVVLCVAAADRFEWRARQTKIFGRDRVTANHPIAQLGDRRLAGK